MCAVKFYSMGEITLHGHVLDSATMCLAHIHALTHSKTLPFLTQRLHTHTLNIHTNFRNAL